MQLLVVELAEGVFLRLEIAPVPGRVVQTGFQCSSIADRRGARGGGNGRGRTIGRRLLHR